MSKLVLEFDNEAARELFLSMLCDGGIENTIYESMSMHDLCPRFDYKRAFGAWGWDEIGDPVVEVHTDPEE